MEKQNYLELQDQLQNERRDFRQYKCSMQRDFDKQRLELVKMENELLEFRDEYEELEAHKKRSAMVETQAEA